MELDKVSETYFETRRLYELMKTQLESVKLENEKVLTDAKARYSEEIGDLVADNHAL